MNPWLILAAALALAGLAGGAYRLGREDGENKIVAQQARESEIAQKAADAATSAAADAISKITIKHQTVRQEVEREVQTREVFRDPGCRTGPDLLRLYNDAIPGAASALGAGNVPAANPGN